MPFPRLIAALVLLPLEISLAPAQQYTISTTAGGAPPPTPVLGINASIGFPQGVVTDSAGNVYSTGLNCVLKLDTNGVLTRVVGKSRQPGFSGDGGPATSAQLNYGVSAPKNGVALDSAGSLYIADTGNGRVRKVSPAGIITTVAGNGTLGYSGDGGPATGAQLSSPVGVAVDSAGNLYVADVGNNTVRKVSAAGIITTVAGNGAQGYSGDSGAATSAELNLPEGVAVGSNGNLYIADQGNHRVRAVSSAGTITTVAGNGTQGYSGDSGAATSAELNAPGGVAVDSGGNLYIADTGNQRVRKVSTAGTITTVAGNGTQGYSGDSGAATSAELYAPSGVAVDGAGNLYIADYGNYRVRKVSTAAVISTIAGNGWYSYSGDGGPAVSAQLWVPSGLAVDSAGQVFIADTNNHAIRKTSGGIITTVAGNGTQGNSGDGSSATSAQLALPRDVAVDGAGNLYIADTGNNRVRRVSPAGVITTFAGTGTAGRSGDGGSASSARLWSPFGVALDSAGNVYIADSITNRVRQVSPAGIITTVAGTGTSGYSGDGGPATSAQLDNPTGVAVDGDGSLYIADAGNNRVRKVSASGTITTIAGDGTQGYSGSGDSGPATSARLSYARGVAADSDGNVYIADTDSNRIRRVSADGIITTVAGYGISAGLSGDGGPATRAQLNLPYGVTVDGAGNVYAADTYNDAIRMLTPVPGTPPAIGANALADGAAYRAQVAPGGIVSLFGANLASAAAGATALPLPTALGGASVVVGGEAAPLFYVSPTQINFQVPWELAGQASATVIVSTPAGSSGAQTVALNVVAPGIFTLDSSGKGPGIVTAASTGQLAAAATPVPRGQYITIYCSGLGPASNQPATGAAASANPVSNTLLVPSVTIGGVQAPVSFSGLAPGLVGLYQVNAMVPSSVTPGSAVPVMLTINGASSNTVTIAVQ